MPEPLLILDGVTLLAGDGRVVFRDLHWRLDRGARLHMRGGTGGGATALLRLAAGIAQPETGRVLLEGLPLDGGAHPFLARGALGWVPSDGGLLVNLSLLDNVALPLRFALNLPKAEARDQALAWLERAGLADRALARPHVPGDGQAWLTALARAAAKGSQLWLVDRPPGGLDPASVRAAAAILTAAGQDPAVTQVLVGGEWMAALGEDLRFEDGTLRTGRQA